MSKYAIGYIRVSSEEQITNYSLSNQEDKCKDFCKSNGYELLSIFREEGKSATTLNRPELINLLEYCRKNKGKVDACVIYKIDRLSRNTYDFLEIKRRLASCGVAVVSITEPTDDSPTGEFMETMMAAQARFDNALKSERTKEGMTKRLEAGLPTNPLPVGYKYQLGEDGKNHPVRDDPKFSLLQQAGYDYMTGIYNKVQIADILNKRGFTTKKNKSVCSQFISDFFANKFYKGVIYSKVRNQDYIGSYEKMFTEEEWYKIQQISKGNHLLAQPRKRNNPDFPLRHFTVCGKCGKPISGNWSKGRNNRYAYYRCLDHAPSIPVETFECEFVELLESIKPSKETVERFTEVLKAKYNDKYRELTKDVSTLNRQLEELKNEQRILVKKNLKGIYDDELFMERNEEIKDEIVIKQTRISESSIDKINIDTVCTFANHFINNISQTWRTADLDTKQRLQEIIFPEGVIYDFPGFRTATLSCLFNVLRESSESNEHLGWLTGLEPATSSSTERRSNQLSYNHRNLKILITEFSCILPINQVLLYYEFS